MFSQIALDTILLPIHTNYTALSPQNTLEQFKYILLSNLHIHTHL
jgi:hypothetical protein